MTTENDRVEEQNQQISFDARQGRAMLLLDWTYTLSKAQANNDYVGWIKSLNNIYYICFAYVKDEDANNVKKTVKRAESLVNLYLRKSNVNVGVVLKSLDLATEECLKVFKDQFMQTTSREEGEFDPTKFDGD